MLIRRAEVEGCAPLDVRIRNGRIDAQGGLSPEPGEEVLDAAGGALLPGLHDHHLHLLALAAAQRSVRCGPPEVRDRAGLARALARAPAGPGWVRGIGYHEVVAGPLDRTALDELVPDRPTRVQHRSGALWIVNSAGAQRLGLDQGDTPQGVERDASGRATGRLYRLDAWLRARAGEPGPPDLAPVGRRLCAYGVTGVTDATAANGAAELEILVGAVRSGALPQRVLVMGRPDLPEPGHPGLARAAVKLVLAEAELPRLEELERWIRDAHAAGRGVAIHCVTRVELALASAALGLAGARPGDRVEHAAVAPPELVAGLHALGLTVVTQPGFVRERGDVYAAEVEERDRRWLYRCRGFLQAGVSLGAGTDAPFGDPDPWLAIRAAVDRRTEAGAPLGPQEALPPERALALFTSSPEDPGGAPRRVAKGAPADLCLLDRPWGAARRELSSDLVAATLCAGALLWQRGR